VKTVVWGKCDRDESDGDPRSTTSVFFSSVGREARVSGAGDRSTRLGECRVVSRALGLHNVFRAAVQTYGLFSPNIMTKNSQTTKLSCSGSVPDFHTYNMEILWLSQAPAKTKRL
jgi:hypothetical protein